MAVKTEDKRRRILSAALDCFEKQGFDAARMDDIARRAGVAKGTIYNYFKNKEELLRALAEGFAGVMRRNLENVARDQDKDLSFKETFLRIAAPLIDGTPRSKRNPAHLSAHLGRGASCARAHPRDLRLALPARLQAGRPARRAARPGRRAGLRARASRRPLRADYSVDLRQHDHRRRPHRSPPGIRQSISRPDSHEKRRRDSPSGDAPGFRVRGALKVRSGALTCITLSAPPRSPQPGAAL